MNRQPRRPAGKTADELEVLYDYAAERNEDDLLELVVVRTGQHQFSEVVRDYLKPITYGSDGWAAAVFGIAGAEEVAVLSDHS